LFCLFNIVNVDITIDSCFPIVYSDGLVQDLIEIELKLEAVETPHFVFCYV
jgi:hypothetical protein